MRALLTLSLLLLSTLLQAAPAWLDHAGISDASRHWHWQSDDSEDGWLLPDQQDHSQPILFIYSKPSSAYDTALTQIALSLYSNRQRRAIHVVNHRLQPERVARLLQDPRYAVGFVAGSRATSALYPQADKLAFPLVSVTAKDPVLLGLVDDYTPTGNRFVFTSLNLRTEVLVRYLQLLDPELKNIAILYGEQNRSARITQVEPLIREAGNHGITARALAISRDEVAGQLQQQIADARRWMLLRDPTLSHSIFWITGSSSLFGEMDTIDREAGGLPVLSVVPDLVMPNEDSAMLSIGVSFGTNALLAASYAVRLLQGEPVERFSVGVVEPPDVVINFSKVDQANWTIPFPLFELASRVINQRGQVVEESMAMAADAP